MKLHLNVPKSECSNRPRNRNRNRKKDNGVEDEVEYEDELLDGTNGNL